MAPRPTWSGQLRISLVSFPIRLFPASEAGPEISFHQIHKPTGKRIKYQLTAPDVGPVSRDEIVKGYEYSRGKYVTFEPEELEEVRMPQKHTLDMVQFVDIDEIDPMYFDRPYFLTPDGHAAAEPFAVVRDALKTARKAGLGEIVFAGKEHLVAVRACGKGMLLETLRYEEEVRKSDPYFEDIEKVPVDEDQLDLAKELIKKKTAPFAPDRFHDNYVTAVKDLIKAKTEGKVLPEEDEAPAGNVINLMDALKRSVADSGKSEIAPRPSKAKGKPAAQKKTAPKRKAV
jgi:DNA end-binding protein Ku